MESNDIQKLIAKEKGRRSSISSESLKLINLNDSQENVNAQEFLEKVVDIQYDWISNQLDILNGKMQEKRVKPLKAISMEDINPKTKINFTLEESEQYPSNLSSEQIEFLESTNITYDFMVKNLKKHRQNSIKKDLDKINKCPDKFSLDNKSFLTNKYSRLSFSASCHEQVKKKPSSSKDVVQMLNEYFDSKF